MNRNRHTLLTAVVLLGLPLLTAYLALAVARLAPSSLKSADLGFYNQMLNSGWSVQDSLAGNSPAHLIPALSIGLTVTLLVVVRRWVFDDGFRILAIQCGADPWGSEVAFIPMVLRPMTKQSMSELRSASDRIRRDPPPTDPISGVDAGTALSAYELAISFKERVASSTRRSLAGAIIKSVAIGLGTTGVGVMLLMISNGWDWGLSPWLLTLPFGAVALVDYFFNIASLSFDGWTGGAYSVGMNSLLGVELADRR